MAFNLHCFEHLNKNVQHRYECKLCNEKGDIISDTKKRICPIVKNILKLMGETCNIMVGEKMTMKQIKADRQKRSHGHFMKEIYPILGPAEKAHHIAKQKRKKK